MPKLPGQVQPRRRTLDDAARDWRLEADARAWATAIATPVAELERKIKKAERNDRKRRR